MATEFDKSAPPGVLRFSSKVCEHCQPLRHETNILVLARLNVLQRLSDINLGLAFLTVPPLVPGQELFCEVLLQCMNYLTQISVHRQGQVKKRVETPGTMATRLSYIYMCRMKSEFE